MMTLDEARRLLKDRRMFMVAHATGISRSTLHTILSGKNTNPTYAVLLALDEYFRAERKPVE